MGTKFIDYVYRDTNGKECKEHCTIRSDMDAKEYLETVLNGLGMSYVSHKEQVTSDR